MGLLDPKTQETIREPQGFFCDNLIHAQKYLYGPQWAGPDFNTDLYRVSYVRIPPYGCKRVRKYSKSETDTDRYGGYLSVNLHMGKDLDERNREKFRNPKKKLSHWNFIRTVTELYCPYTSV